MECVFSTNKESYMNEKVKKIVTKTADGWEVTEEPIIDVELPLEAAPSGVLEVTRTIRGREEGTETRNQRKADLLRTAVERGELCACGSPATTLREDRVNDDVTFSCARCSAPTRTLAECAAKLARTSF